MISLRNLYRPITANPFLQMNEHGEYLPSLSLQPYVVCFWGTRQWNQENHPDSVPSIVVPDTCMDLMVTVNEITGEICSEFIGLNDQYFYTEDDGSGPNSVFAVRFYYWSLHLFVHDTLKSSKNQMVDVDVYFKNWGRFFKENFMKGQTIEERIRMTERFLLSKLDTSRLNEHVMNVAYSMVKSKGTQSVKEISQYSCVSQRQLERIYLDHVGISIKKITNMIRYQNILKEILIMGSLDVHDLVLRYGFSDQSHLLKEFKKYHGMTMTEAKTYAFEKK